MKKPMKPKKTYKDLKPTTSYQKIRELLFFDKNNNLVIGDEEYLQYDRQLLRYNYEKKGLKTFNDYTPLTYSKIQEAKSLLKYDVEDFQIESGAECYEITYKIDKSCEQYQEELDNYNCRFEKYESEMVQYYSQMATYQEYRAKQLKEKKKNLLT